MPSSGPSGPHAPTATAAELTDRLHRSFPDTGMQARITVEEVDQKYLRLRYRVSSDGAEIRPGGTVSGPTLMTMADTVAWLLTMAQLPPGTDALRRASRSRSCARRRRPTWSARAGCCAWAAGWPWSTSRSHPTGTSIRSRWPPSPMRRCSNEHPAAPARISLNQLTTGRCVNVPKKLAAGLTALVLLFAACGDDDDADDAATETTTATAATGEAEVDVASTSLGDVLVDAQGFTLYMFDNDQPNTSNCTGQCLDNWSARSMRPAAPS